MIQEETKCWGTVRHIFDKDMSASLLRVKAGFCCSIHRHMRRWNRFIVVSGKIAVVTYDKELKVQSKDTLMPRHRDIDGYLETLCIAPTIWHRFEVLESGLVAEVYWTTDGSDVEHSDIVRMDVGGRF